MKKLILIIIATIIIFSTNIFSSEIGNVYIPFNTFNDKWDHRWYSLLPDSEQYESIEILSFDNKDFLNSVFVLVKLISKTDGNQTFYFNNLHKANSWHHESKHSPMIYKTDGEFGKPLDLQLSFTDEYDNYFEVNFNCQNSEALDDGLADVTTNNAHEVISVIAFEMSCIPEFLSVSINDQNISYDNKKNSSDIWKYKPMYSFNNYNLILKGNAKITISEKNRVYEKDGFDFNVTKDGNKNILRTKNIGFKKYVEIIADSLNQMESYTYYNFDNYFKFEFDPPLHSTKTPETENKSEQKVIKTTFTISASHIKDTIYGESLSDFRPGFIHTEWYLIKPSWASEYNFMTDMTLQNKYVYQLMVLPLPD